MKVKWQWDEYALNRVLLMTAVVAATLVIVEGRALTIRQTCVFEKLVGAHHVLRSIHMVAGQMFCRP